MLIGSYSEKFGWKQNISFDIFTDYTYFSNFLKEKSES